MKPLEGGELGPCKPSVVLLAAELSEERCTDLDCTMVSSPNRAGGVRANQKAQ